MKHVVYNERAGGIIKSKNYALGMAVTGLLVIGAAVPVANALTNPSGDLGDNGKPAQGRGIQQVAKNTPADDMQASSDAADSSMTGNGAWWMGVNQNAVVAPMMSASAPANRPTASQPAADPIITLPIDVGGGRGGEETETPPSDGGGQPTDDGGGEDPGGIEVDVPVIGGVEVGGSGGLLRADLL